MYLLLLGRSGVVSPGPSGPRIVLTRHVWTRLTLTVARF